MSMSGNAETIKEHANICFRNGLYKDSVNLYTKAIDQSPTSIYYSNRAAAYLKLGEFQEAIRDCQQAVQLDPSNERAVVRAARANLHLANIDEAMSLLQNALETNPANEAAQKDMRITQEVSKYLSQAEIFLQNGHAGLALHSLESAFKFLDIVPWQWKMKKAMCLLEQNNTGEAVNLASDLLRSSPQNPEILWLRGYILYRDGDTTRAITHCQEALRCDPDHTNSRNLLKLARKLETTKEAGNQEFKAGNLEEAIIRYSEALDLDPGNKSINSKILSNRATVYMKLGKYTDALDDCNASLDRDPLFTKVLRTRARLNALLEDHESAVRDFKEALSREPNNADLQRELRKAELDFKKSKRKDYYKILGVSKDFSESDLKKAYRRECLRHHPDKNLEKSDTAFKDVQEAYEVLSDTQKRYRYDNGLDEQEPGSAGMNGGMHMNMEDVLQQMFGGSMNQNMGGGFGSFDRSHSGSSHFGSQGFAFQF